MYLPIRVDTDLYGSEIPTRLLLKTSFSFLMDIVAAVHTRQDPVGTITRDYRCMENFGLLLDLL